MDFTKLLLTLGGVVVAGFFLGLFGYILYHLFPLLSYAQDIFLGLFSAMKYHTSSMVTFGTALFGYVSLRFYWLVSSFIK